jgi:superfamily II DNA or RNA helicase
VEAGTGLRLPRKLWAHQRAAVEAIDSYLRVAAQGSHREKSSLITMPTGTGKTGVIACATALLPTVTGHRLVLTPWDALVRQMIGDLEKRFWDKVPPPAGTTLPKVERLPPSSEIATIAERQDETIYVATIQAILTLYRSCVEAGREISDLFAGLGLVMVDEGHYEPADKWSKAIRALKRPTVLMTATPYRNDHEFFLLEENVGRFRFTHAEAERKHFLRRVNFETIEAGDEHDFIAHVSELSEPDAKVIVRCATADGIERMVKTIEEMGDTVVGVHERFKGRSAPLCQHVPATTEPFRFWVHQYKLVEGIDDPAFKVLVFYDDLGNDRAVIQQIGRVLRNPGMDADGEALVISRTGGAERAWLAYRVFDDQDESISVATAPTFVLDFLETHPSSLYYDRRYRTKIDLDDANAWRLFAFPLRTRVFRANADILPSLDELADQTAIEWAEDDRIVSAATPVLTPDDRTRIVPFIYVENSRLLKRGTFLEPSFGYTVLRRTDDLLFFVDSRGALPKVVAENFVAVDPAEMSRLFDAKRAQLTAVSLRNTNLARQAARSRQVRALEIDALAPDLSDYGYVCSVAEGRVTAAAQDPYRRYVGLTRSRVVDHQAQDLEYKTFSEWLDAVAVELNTTAKPVATFDRYAKYVATPSDTTPAYVLLDVDPARFARTSGGTTVKLEFEEAAVPVTAGRFTLKVNGGAHLAQLDWNANLKRYDFQAPTLKAESFVSTETDRRELVTFVNEEQALRIVVSGSKTVYSGGHFTEAVIPRKASGSFQLLDILTPITALSTTSDEKGRTVVDGDWEASSVFGLLSALAPSNPRHATALLEFKAVLPTCDFVLCSDMGAEVADFILANGDERVVFVHAKATAQKHKYSASQLHDVVMQATKNLPYLQPLGQEAPRYSRWNAPWNSAGLTIAQRLREGDPAVLSTGEKMWKNIRARIANPQTEREVWLVLGQMLSRSALDTESTKKPPTAEAIQVFGTLQAAWSAVSQVGARLRIFCSE